MSEPSEPEDGSPVVVLNAFPDGSLSVNQIKSLRDGDAIDIVAPLVIDTRTTSITHLDLVIDDRHYFVGWNPEKEQWERILVVVDEGETSVLEAAISVIDDVTGDAVLTVAQDSNPDTEDIVEFVWEYVKYTYSDTERLYNMMEEALEEATNDH